MLRFPPFGEPIPDPTYTYQTLVDPARLANVKHVRWQPYWVFVGRSIDDIFGKNRDVLSLIAKLRFSKKVLEYGELAFKRLKEKADAAGGGSLAVHLRLGSHRMVWHFPVFPCDDDDLILYDGINGRATKTLVWHQNADAKMSSINNRFCVLKDDQDSHPNWENGTGNPSIKHSDAARRVMKRHNLSTLYIMANKKQSTRRRFVHVDHKKWIENFMEETLGPDANKALFLDDLL